MSAGQERRQEWRQERRQERRRGAALAGANPADIWVAVTFCLIALGVLIAHQMYGAIESMAEMRYQNARQIIVWRQVTRNIEFLMSEPESEIRGIDTYAAVRDRLTQLLDEAAERSVKFEQAMQHSPLTRRFFGQMTGDVDDDLLRRLDVHSELLRRAHEVRDMPDTLLSSNFSFWPTQMAIAVQGERYIQPLIERSALLSQQARNMIRAIYIEGSILLALLLICLLSIWLFFLRPAIRRLGRTRAQLQLILDNLPAYLCSFSPDGVYRAANRSYREAVGYPGPARLEGKRFSDVVGPERWRLVQDRIDLSGDSDLQQFEIESDLTGRDGVLLVSYDLLRDKAGKVSEIIVVLVDITPLSEARRQLRLNEEHLRITLGSIGEGVITTDTAHRIRSINSRAAALTGWNPDQALGQPLSRVFRTSDASDASGGTGSAGEPENQILRARDGSERLISGSETPITDAGGAMQGIVAVFRDVTEERRLRDSLAQAEKLQAIGLLASGIAHDFNNILSGIQGNADLMAAGLAAASQRGPDRGADQMPDLAPRLAGIGHLIRRGAGLTEQLVQFAHARPARSELIDLAAVVRGSLDLLASTTPRRISFRFHDVSRNSQLHGDESALQAAIVNVLLNAVDAIEGTGTIDLHLDNVTRGDIATLAGVGAGVGAGERDRSDPFLRLAITDSGSGMAPDLLSRIFEPFFTTKELGRGVGLGLSATYGTMRTHGGDVQARSTPGKGSTLSLFLPAAAGAPGDGAGPALPEAAPPPEAQGLTVLFADDEPTLCEAASQFLGARGHHVLVARNGRETVDLFRRYHGRIDVVVLDLNMPVMTGQQAMQRILQIAPQTRFIVTSGHSPGPADLMAGGDHDLSFLPKPYSFHDLATALSRAMRAGTANGA